MTAVIRDLHRWNPGFFETDVRTHCPELWFNNPFIIALDDSDPSVEVLECHYPLVHESNSGLWHFIHGMQQHLALTLGVKVQPTEMKGDIYLTSAERSAISQVEEMLRIDVPFWIIVAGGKHDFTAKWWEHRRYQEVVDYFSGRILFVQVGDASHHHPKLHNVLDLRGRTSLRQLIRLVHYSQGVLCPVTLLMHLCAAIETKRGRPPLRPCVVVAGGREPAQWEAYPGHQFIHNNGALPCCTQGGCWKSRVMPLHDGEEGDAPHNLCVNPVAIAPPYQDNDWVGREAGSSKTNAAPTHIPRCLDMISAGEVIRRIETYFTGGVTEYLSNAQAKVVRERLRAIEAGAGRTPEIR